MLPPYPAFPWQHDVGLFRYVQCLFKKDLSGYRRIYRLTVIVLTPDDVNVSCRGRILFAGGVVVCRRVATCTRPPRPPQSNLHWIFFFMVTAPCYMSSEAILLHTCGRSRLCAIVRPREHLILLRNAYICNDITIATALRHDLGRTCFDMYRCAQSTATE